MSVPDVRLAPIRTPIGSEPENATMQLLHQTWRSRIDRLNAAGVIGSSSGKYGHQQRFSASTRSPMSSVRQKRYADTIDPARDQCSRLWVLLGTVSELTSLRYPAPLPAGALEVAAEGSG